MLLNNVNDEIKDAVDINGGLSMHINIRLIIIIRNIIRKTIFIHKGRVEKTKQGQRAVTGPCSCSF